MHTKLFAAAGIAAALLPMPASAQTPSTSLGQAYPAKAVRIIVGLAPGGGNDTMARLIADSRRLRSAVRGVSRGAHRG